MVYLCMHGVLCCSYAVAFVNYTFVNGTKSTPTKSSGAVTTPTGALALVPCSSKSPAQQWNITTENGISQIGISASKHQCINVLAVVVQPLCQQR